VTTREQLLYEIENAPDFLLEEVLDFLLFTKNRRQPPGDESVQPLDPAQPPIWESFEEFAEQLPADISATLPTDGAAQIDHYLYGSPKHD
jgi:hypothetical protein